MPQTVSDLPAFLRSKRDQWYRIMANRPAMQDSDLLNGIVQAADRIEALEAGMRDAEAWLQGEGLYGQAAAVKLVLNSEAK